MTTAWLPLALGATLAWGIGQIVAKKGVGALGPRGMVMLIALGEVGLFSLLGLALGAVLPASLEGSLLALAAGLAGMLGYLAYFEAIARGTISRIGTITAAYPAGTVVLALLFLREVLTGLQALGVVLLLGAAVLLGHAESHQHGRPGVSMTPLILASFLLWALWGILVKLAVEAMGEGASLVYFGLANGLVGLGLLARPSVRGAVVRAGARALGWPLAAVLLGGTGVVFMTLAFAQGPASLVTPVTGAYPVVTVLAAVGLLRERVRGLDVLAFVAFALGLFAVAWA